MLAKVAPPTNDFRALARYLVRGKQGTEPDPKRVAWVLSRNLPTDDLELAAKYMEATAKLSARTAKPAYHLMIAWNAREHPTPDSMQTVAMQTLHLAGLADHQALIMGHGDKPHPHLHILLNRVHPETGRAWKTSQDFARFDRIMRQLADGHGYEYVPAHTFNPERTDTNTKLPDSAATYAAKRGAPTGRPQWSKAQARAFGRKLSEDITPESTSGDVGAVLATHGMRVEQKGHGYVVGDDASYAKLSSLGLATSARAMDLLRNASPTRRPARNVFSVTAVDIAYALHGLGLLSLEDVHSTLDEARIKRQQLRAQRRLKAIGAATALTSALERVTQPPLRQHHVRPKTVPKAR